MADQGTPYHTDIACDCNNCRIVYEGHNLSAVGVDLQCTCHNCYLRRRHFHINGPQWQQAPDPPKRTNHVQRTKHATTRGTRKSMSTINMCEREGCGAMMKSTAAGLLQAQSNATYGANGAEMGFIFDGELCPGCIGDIVAMLRTAPTTPREKAYSKPWTEADAPKSDSPLTSLTDEELASELLARRGVSVALELTQRPQDDVDDALENPRDKPRNVTNVEPW